MSEKQVLSKNFFDKKGKCILVYENNFEMGAEFAFLMISNGNIIG
jgi:hypothetical protein